MVDQVSIVSIVLALIVGGVLVLCVVLWGRHCRLCSHRASKSGARLPKGSIGWPIVGESLSFIRNPEIYASAHIKRYGKIFKSSLFLEPMILGATPEFAKLVTTDTRFVTGYPGNIKQIIGSKSLISQDGPNHMTIKKIFQKFTLPEAIRTKVNVLETIIAENLASWEQKGTITGRDGCQKVMRIVEGLHHVSVGFSERNLNEIAQITVDTSIWLLLGYRHFDRTPEGKEAIENFESLNKAVASLPMNLPGTNFTKGLKAKAALTKYFKDLMEERRSQTNAQDDFLSFILAAQVDHQVREELEDFDDEVIVDNLVQFWFGANETTSTTLTWVLKYLVDYPEVFRRIQAEQQEILASKSIDHNTTTPRLSWDDYKKMVYTRKFFHEVQRIVSVGAIAIRRATKDVEFEGHLIPKGWAVSVMYQAIHLDPKVYPDPGILNPDRFDVTPNPCTYLPFSFGPHRCPGMEVAMLIVLTFVHYLTTSYAYESAGPDLGIEYDSLILPIGGYPITIRLRN